MSNIEALATIILKLAYYLLYRPVLQTQLLFILAILLVSWLAARRGQRLIRQWLPAVFPGQEAGPHPIEQEYRGTTPQSAEMIEAKEAEQPPKFTWRQRIREATRTLLPELLLPSVALFLAAVARGWLSTQTQFVGLIDEFFWYLGLFWLYRLAVGILDVLIDEKYASRYHYQLLAPVFVLYILYQVVSWFIDPQLLGQIVVFELFENEITWGNIFVATVGFYLWLQLARLLQDTLYHIITRQRSSIAPGTVNASLTLMRYFLIIIGLFLVFNELQFNPTTVAAITTGVTAGIAFGSREILNNFIGGILLLFEQSIRPGDTIEINDTMGVVTAVNIRATTVQAYDGREIIVPNAQVLTSSVVTYTKSSRYARIRIDVGVSYDADLKEVLEILRAIPPKHENVIDDPEPSAFLIGFGDSSVNFSLFAWVEDLSQKFVTTHELYFMVWDAFQEAGIDIPFPQQDLHIKSTTHLEELALERS